MCEFKDKSGRAWQVSVTLGSAMAVAAALDVDLLAPEKGEPDLMSQLATDEMLLGKVICELLRPQMEERKLTEKDVYALFDGETLLAACDAFWTEMGDFFQSRGRHDRAAAVRKTTALVQAAIKAAETRVEQIDPERVLGQVSGDSPASSV